MNDTPRTDAKRSGENHFMGDWVDANFACQLERELNAANDRIKRLEEDRIDKMARLAADILKLHRPDSEAKEAKP